MRPELAALDWCIIGLYGVAAMGLGAWFSRKQTDEAGSFFVGDRKLSWWMAGTSIVATTFAADTPLAVTGLVASGGVSGNWIWWSWGIAHLSATFFFARLWRRSGVVTDAEITELRYGGNVAAALRGFKAVYFGVFLNCLTMAWVIAAMVKISSAFFDIDPGIVIAACITFSVIYTSLGGFRSVVYTDFAQFLLGMAGAITLAVLVLDHFGGMGSTAANTGLLGGLARVSAEAGRDVGHVIEFIPRSDHPGTPLPYFIVMLFVGWWRYAEGSGYVVQRLAACKDEGHAHGASLWFSIAHNALRPWPWIIVGLGALVVYPQLAPSTATQLQAGGITVTPASLDVVAGGQLTITGNHAFTHARVQGQTVSIDARGIATFSGFESVGLAGVILSGPGKQQRLPGMRLELHDREMAYPLLMGKFLPAGLLGLVIASLLAAFMSTIDTHTNWGASYLVQDIYVRFVKPEASPAQILWVSRIAIILMAILAGFTATFVTSIAEVWRFIVALGAGLGSVSAARWYWSRVTPHAEFAALAVTTVSAVSLQLFCTKTLFGGENNFYVFEVDAWQQILIIAGASLATWIPVSLLGPRNSPETLQRFADKVRPGGPGWAGIGTVASESAFGRAWFHMGLGLIAVYGTLFGIGSLLMGSAVLGIIALGVAAASLAGVIRGAR